jgi:hypothetical protein
MALFPLGILSAAGAGGADLGSYELIETQILASATPSITFSSLGTYSSTYKHLQVRITNRQTGAGNIVSIGMRFNGDTGANYSFHRLQGTGSAVQSDAFSTQTSGFISGSPAASEAANAFGAYVVDILDAFSTTKYKTSRNLSGVMATNGQIHLNSNLWQSTSSITSITFTAQNTDHAIGSRFSLYGIKG